MKNNGKVLINLGNIIYLFLISFLNVSSQDLREKSVKIGQQEWMTENLNVSNFSNGDLILEAKNKEQWQQAFKSKTPAWCYYNNDTVNGLNYGKLYNWYAINDKRGLSPKGWHIPTHTEWCDLVNFLSITSLEGEKMKSTIGWFDNGNGNNNSGFNGLPGGFRNISGDFIFLGYFGNWWSSTAYEDLYIWNRVLSYGDNKLSRYNQTKGNGFSVRCVKD
jgi:uncharacterized protein (TIGR02145 family)